MSRKKIPVCVIHMRKGQGVAGASSGAPEAERQDGSVLSAACVVRLLRLGYDQAALQQFRMVRQKLLDCLL